MPHDLLSVARRHLRRRVCEENEVKGEKPPAGSGNVTPHSAPSPFVNERCGTSSAGGNDFPPLSSFSSTVASENDAPAPTGWGCNCEEVGRLIAAADEHFARSGVSSEHPAIKAAVEVVMSAVSTGDIETLRYAVAEFRAAVSEIRSKAAAVIS